MSKKLDFYFKILKKHKSHSVKFMDIQIDDNGETIKEMLFDFDYFLISKVKELCERVDYLERKLKTRRSK